MDDAATVVLNPDLLCYYFDKIEERSQIKLAELLQKLSLPGNFWKEFKEVYSIHTKIRTYWSWNSMKISFTCDEFQKALLFVDEKELAEELKCKSTGLHVLNFNNTDHFGHRYAICTGSSSYAPSLIKIR